MPVTSYQNKAIALGILLLMLFCANVSFGSSFISPVKFFSFLFGSGDANTNELLWQFRLPKAVTCVFAGMSLAVGGMLMQTLFKNPLAGPDVLGLSSGASLAVALILMLEKSGMALLQNISNSPWSLAIAATVGSSAVFLLVLVFAQAIRDNASLLLIGLMVSAATSSIVGVLQFVSQAEDLQLFLIWSLGNVSSTGWKEIIALMVIFVVGLLIVVAQIKSLNGRLLGETYAQSLGINLRRSRFWIVTATSLMAGSVTAFCGPIAFVGLAVPHFIRLVFRTSDHKKLIPVVMMGGAALLLFCDWVAHLVSPNVLPVNAVTSMIGAPLVIWMILKNKKVSL